MKSRIDWHAIYYGELKPGMTVATRFPDYAVSTHHVNREQVPVHLVSDVIIDWRSDPISFGAMWRCGGKNGSQRVRFVTADIPTCERCLAVYYAEQFGAVVGVPYVYYAKRDGLIKIGHSTNVGMRMYALRAELLAVEPAWGGEHTAELARHREFEQHRRIGEWFDPSPELLAHIQRLAS